MRNLNAMVLLTQVQKLTTSNKIFVPKNQRKKRIISFAFFYGLNKLIDVNECEILCNKQLKEDTLQYIKVSIQQNSMLSYEKMKQNKIWKNFIMGVYTYQYNPP